MKVHGYGIYKKGVEYFSYFNCHGLSSDKVGELTVPADEVVVTIEKVPYYDEYEEDGTGIGEKLYKDVESYKPKDVKKLKTAILTHMKNIVGSTEWQEFCAATVGLLPKDVEFYADKAALAVGKITERSAKILPDGSYMVVK